MKIRNIDKFIGKNGENIHYAYLDYFISRPRRDLEKGGWVII